MCAVLSEHGVPISPSTYYEWITKTPTRRQLRDTELIAVIAAQREDKRTGKFVQTLGSRKMWIRLRGQGHEVARCTVERIMGEQGWEGARYGSRHKTTIADDSHPRYPDLVDRNFHAPAPNRLWVADFTYVPTWRGFVYVAFVIDAFSRRIVGWRAATSMTTALVLDAVEHAFFTRAQEGRRDLTGLIAHNDAGAQYTSVAFTQRLLDEGVDPSVGSVGDALDNALAETTVGSFKNELIRRQGPWHDVNHVELGTAEWVQWFNTERPHEYLDDFTPEAVEKLHYDHRRTHRRRGDPTKTVSGLPGTAHRDYFRRSLNAPRYACDVLRIKSAWVDNIATASSETNFRDAPLAHPNAPGAGLRCLICGLFRDSVQFYSGLVDLVVGVRRDGGGR